MREASGRDDAIGVAADVGIAEGCRSLIAAQPEADILVNNLGIYGACEFFEIDDALWEQYFEVNVLSGVRLARHYAKGMRERGWGRIQFISSESALNIPTEMVHYGVSKAAVQGLSRGLAKVLAGSGVTVNAILPGPTRTEGAITMMANLAAERGVSPSEMEACSWPRTDLRHCCGVKRIVIMSLVCFSLAIIIAFVAKRTLRSSSGPSINP